MTFNLAEISIGWLAEVFTSRIDIQDDFSLTELSFNLAKLSTGWPKFSKKWLLSCLLGDDQLALAEVYTR